MTPGPAWMDVVARLPQGPGRVLLHSTRDDDGLGRASFAAVAPRASIVVRGSRVTIREADTVSVFDTDEPLAALAEFVEEHRWASADHRAVGEVPAFAGAQDTHTRASASVPTAVPSVVPTVMGYIGYEVGARVEHVEARPGPSAVPGVPDAVLYAYDAVITWNGSEPHPRILARSPTAHAACARMLQHAPTVGSAPQLGPLQPVQDGDAHCARIHAAQALIAAGDIYQVNLARQWQAACLAPGDPLALYAVLAEMAPAPYAGFCEFEGGTLFSASPELFIAQRGRSIETRPIKGTRPRGGDAAADRALAADLCGSVKDSAEHNMIVDLERNDLGRICDVGSVHVAPLGYIVKLPHVLHRISRVMGKLAGNVDVKAMLYAMFPGGSITGAPKVRAMQVIRALEPFGRGPYCGALGWFGADACELAIAIRVGVLTRDALTAWVGGGIVADSVALDELRETDDKLRGWQQALATLAVHATHAKR